MVGYPDGRLGERAAAFIRLREDGALSFEEMIAHLETQQMARQYMPERPEILEDCRGPSAAKSRNSGSAKWPGASRLPTPRRERVRRSALTSPVRYYMLS